MSYSKISSIVLWVIAVVSLVVIIFFYVSPRMLDEDTDVKDLETRYTSLKDKGHLPDEGEAGAEDLFLDDELAAPSDSISDEEGEAVDSEDAVAEEDSIAEAPVITTSMAKTEKVGLSYKEIKNGNYFTSKEWLVYKRTDYALIWAYILFGIGLLAALIFPLIKVVTDVKAIIQTVVILAGAAVLVLISYYVLSSDTALYIKDNEVVNTTSASAQKWVGTGLFTTYMLFGLALLSILYSEVVKIFK
jgi:hypothetical protein